jgi:hypothetical protein
MRRTFLPCCALLLSLPLPLAGGQTPAVSERAEGTSFTAHLTQVHPWCDHMPIMRKGERRQYLIALATLGNKASRPVTVALARASISFDAASEGAPVRGLSLRGSDDRASGKTSVTIEPGAELKVRFRGDNLYPEGKHGQTLYLTLTFAAGRERLVVRGSGRVEETI